MRSLRSALLRFFALFGRSRRDVDLSAELDGHMQLHIDDNRRAGMEPGEARRDALLKLGGVEMTKEAYRQQRQLMWLDNLGRDLNYALRALRRSPGFALFALLTLAVGIGAATAVFTLVNAVLLRALPFHEPDRLAWMYNARVERDRAPFSIGDLEDYTRESTTLDGVAPFTNWTANLTGSGEAERLEGVRVSGNFFPLVGTSALLGRTLQTADEAANAKVVVITFDFWRRHFGSRQDIVGQSIVLNGAGYTVAGVLPPDFLFPFRYAEVAVPLPLAGDARRADRGANFLRAVARLKPGVSFAHAKADLDVIAARLQRRFPDDDARKTGVNLFPLHAEIVSDYRRILWTLFGAVAILLLAGCGNLANLLLVRGVGRRAELGVRRSLGASRGRIIQQLTTEAVVLAALGGVGGLAVAQSAIRAWHAFGPASFPRMDGVAMDARVLAFAGMIALVTAVVCSATPAWFASRDAAPAPGDTTRTATGGIRQGFVRRSFVALQVGAAAVLLVCMGLVARGFTRLERVDPGFSTDHRLSMQLSLPPGRYSTPDTLMRFHDALRVGLTSIPGVQAAGAVSLLPLGGLLSTVDLAFPGQPPPPPERVPQAHFRLAGAGYFAAAGISLFDGREFSESDSGRSLPVAIVSRRFAERHWPGQRAVGQHVQVVLNTPSTPLEVVGVVSDVKQFDLESAPTADLYVPIHQMPPGQAATLAARMYWVVRTQGDPRLLNDGIRRTVQTIDSEVATSSMRTLDEVVVASLAARRTSVQLLEAFGELAIVLCAFGVYAITAFAASGRRRELAIRSAFGASPRQLAALMFREEIRPVAVGLILGLIAAAAAVPTLVGTVFGTSPWDPAVYAGAAAALFVLAAFASYLPANRATRVDPIAALRAD